MKECVRIAERANKPEMNMLRKLFIERPTLTASISSSFNRNFHHIYHARKCFFARRFLLDTILAASGGGGGGSVCVCVCVLNVQCSCYDDEK